MCGILGIFYYRSDSKPESVALNRATNLLEHRGPDNQSVYCDDTIGLGHTRLSLLDLNPRSNQPFWDSSGRYGIVYNGEIYNFQQLRQSLEKEGIAFVTTCDTEVLLYGLIRWGIQETLRKIEGMYAFGFFDKAEQSLTLVRDRFGIKPLYYCDHGDRFVFASEIKGLEPWVRFEPDTISLCSYLQGSGGPMVGPTFFRHIQSLPPGCMISIRRGRPPQIRRYFSLSDLWDPSMREELQQIKPHCLVDMLDEHLSNNVRQMLIADAPVGALCSGGLDSSLIMALATKYHTNLAIFHANVQGRYSELPFAEMLARHLKLDLLKVDISDMDFIQSMPDVLYHYGHPYIYHLNSVPFYMVSRLIRQHHVKAVLSGEGADECFYGYPWHLFNTLAAVKDIIHCPYKYLKALFKNTSTLPWHPIQGHDYGRSLVNRMEQDLEEHDLFDQLKDLTGGPIKPRDFTTFQMLGYHLRTLLHRNDTLGMAAGIEARFPFLDLNTVKFAVNLPYSQKAHFSLKGRNKLHLFIVDKWILRQLAARYIPSTLSHRHKLGFTASTAWRTDVRCSYFYNSWVQQTLNLSKEAMTCLFEHCPGNFKLRLLQLDVWARLFLLSENKDTIADTIIPAIQFRPE